MEMIGAGEARIGADGADRAATGPNGVLTGPDGVFTGADGVFTRADGVMARPNGSDGAATGPHGVFTGADGVMARPDGVEINVHNILAEEQSKLLADIAAYKAQISFLESKLAELGFTEDASNDDSVTWAEELFEDRGVEQPENQAEDQAPMPTALVFPPNEVDRKGKRQMTDLEL
jgi:hypothetical protein